MSKQSFEDIDMVPLLVFYANGKKKVDIIGFTRFASEISKLKNVDSMEFGSDVYQIETVDLLK
jgi:thioredoxin-like negative regulator of GroEL